MDPLPVQDMKLIRNTRSPPSSLHSHSMPTESELQSEYMTSWEPSTAWGQLPYTASYLKYTRLSAALGTITPPLYWAHIRWEATQEEKPTQDSRSLPSGWSTEVITASPVPAQLEAYYYESTVKTSPHTSTVESLVVGYCAGNGVRLAAYGGIDGLTSESGLTALVSASSFTVDDVIGCGVIRKGSTLLLGHGLMFFFTLNGSLRGIVDLDFNETLDDTAEIIPMISTDLDPYGNISVLSNFGQKRFVFLIEDYLQQRRMKVLQVLAIAEVLPEDILEQIVRQAISSWLLDPSSSRQSKSLVQSLSLVCRRWYSLCHPSLARSIRTRSFRHLQVYSASSLRLTRTLSMLQPPPSRVWFHRLAASAIPKKMEALTSLHCSIEGRYAGSYDQAVPPWASTILPALLRDGFAAVQTLHLVSHRFASWLVFAKFVHSFHRLHHLVLRDVEWVKDGVDAPPLWLRSYGGLSEIEVDEKARWYGHLWLLLAPLRAGQQTNKPNLSLQVHDMRVIARMFRLLSESAIVEGPVGHITQEYRDHKIIVTARNTEHDLVASFVFNGDTEHAHELHSVSIHLRGDVGDTLSPTLQSLSHCRATLISADSCSYLFELEHVEPLWRIQLARSIRGAISPPDLLLITVNSELFTDDQNEVQSSSIPEADLLEGPAQEAESPAEDAMQLSLTDVTQLPLTDAMQLPPKDVMQPLPAIQRIELTTWVRRLARKLVRVANPVKKSTHDALRRVRDGMGKVL